MLFEGLDGSGASLSGALYSGFGGCLDSLKRFCTQISCGTSEFGAGDSGVACTTAKSTWKLLSMHHGLELIEASGNGLEGCGAGREPSLIGWLEVRKPRETVHRACDDHKSGFLRQE